jgi:hypothetical protein
MFVPFEVDSTHACQEEERGKGNTAKKGKPTAGKGGKPFK